MGSFDSSNAAGFTTKPLFAKGINSDRQRNLGGFVRQVFAHHTDDARRVPVIRHGPLAMKNVETAVNVVNVITCSPLPRYNLCSAKYLRQRLPQGTEKS